MAVGALDAYFCDAYADCLASVFQAFHRKDKRLLDGVPKKYLATKLPAEALLTRTYTRRPLWAVRMAAREHVKKMNMLDVEELSSFLNPNLPEGEQLWASVMRQIIKDTSKDFTGTTPTDAASISDKQLNSAIGSMKHGLKWMIQLRHDWAHNCGRPKYAIVPYYSTDLKTRRPIEWIRSVVTTVDDHLQNHRIV
jgi:hypothetical protein